MSLATAKRSLALLIEWGTLERLGRNVVRVVSPAVAPADQAPLAPPAAANAAVGPLLALTIRHRGTEIARFSTAADPTSASDLHQVLAAAVARAGAAPDQITEYEMDVRGVADTEPMLTFVASSRTT